jgi:hypothetical protein
MVTRLPWSQPERKRGEVPLRYHYRHRAAKTCSQGIIPMQCKRLRYTLSAYQPSIWTLPMLMLSLSQAHRPHPLIWNCLNRLGRHHLKSQNALTCWSHRMCPYTRFPHTMEVLWTTCPRTFGNNSCFEVKAGPEWEERIIDAVSTHGKTTYTLSSGRRW